MKTVTVDDVIGWGPCYLYELDKGEPYLRKLYSARERWTALQIINEMPPQGVPVQDVLWTVLRPELVSEPTLHELACRYAEALLESERTVGREPDARSWAAVEAKRAWMRGEIDDDELAAARAAASAAWSVAWAAAGAADEVAARAAAWAAAGAAAGDEQLRMTREAIVEEEQK